MDAEHSSSNIKLLSQRFADTARDQPKSADDRQPIVTQVGDRHVHGRTPAPPEPRATRSEPATPRIGYRPALVPDLWIAPDCRRDWADPVALALGSES